MASSWSKMEIFFVLNIYNLNSFLILFRLHQRLCVRQRLCIIQQQQHIINNSNRKQQQKIEIYKTFFFI